MVRPRRRDRASALIAILLPLFFDPLSGFIDDCVIALAYVVMALGLNVVVGFAGLLDLGYVAFFAIGAYTVGWFGSSFFSKAEHPHPRLGRTRRRCRASTSTS